MTIEQTIIDKAIDAGYSPIVDSGNRYKMYLDPKWWQYLGKALGWKIVVVISEYRCKKGCTALSGGYDYGGTHCPKHGELYKLEEREMAYDEWKEQWHQFIDHLAGGGTAESYFEELT